MGRREARPQGCLSVCGGGRGVGYDSGWKDAEDKLGYIPFLISVCLYWAF